MISYNLFNTITIIPKLYTKKDEPQLVLFRYMVGKVINLIFLL